MANKTRLWKLKSHVQLNQNGTHQHGILVDKIEALFFRCNATATLLIPLLSQGATISELSKQLSHHYDLGNGQARADVCGFLQQMTQWELVDEQ